METEMKKSTMNYIIIGTVNFVHIFQLLIVNWTG